MENWETNLELIIKANAWNEPTHFFISLLEETIRFKNEDWVVVVVLF